VGDHAHVREVDDRLVDHGEPARRQRRPQLLLDRVAVVDLRLQPLVEEDVAVAAVGLAPVHGDVGLTDQALGVGGAGARTGTVVDHDPDARRDHDVATAQRDHRLQDRVEPAQQQVQLITGTDPGQQGELVAAEPCDGVDLQPLQPTGHLGEQLVAHGVAVGGR
jgi:hypothetical protein